VAVEVRRGGEEVGGGGGAAEEERGGGGVGAQGVDGVVAVAGEQGGPDVGAGGGELDEEAGGVGGAGGAGGERGPAGRAGFAGDVDRAVGGDGDGARGIGVDAAEVVAPQDGAVGGVFDHEGIEAADQVGAVAGGADGVAGDVAGLVREGGVAHGVDAAVGGGGHGVEAVGARLVADGSVGPEQCAVSGIEGRDQGVGVGVARTALRVAGGEEARGREGQRQQPVIDRVARIQVARPEQGAVWRGFEDEAGGIAGAPEVVAAVVV